MESLLVQISSLRQEQRCNEMIEVMTNIKESLKEDNEVTDHFWDVIQGLMDKVRIIPDSEDQDGLTTWSELFNSIALILQTASISNSINQNHIAK
jgi:ribosome assembly protein YihI (activator of Der GTPase)